MKLSVICATSLLVALVIAVITLLVLQRRQCVKKVPQPQKAARFDAMHANFPVDVVFTWCDQTPEWTSTMQRYMRTEETTPMTEFPVPLLCSDDSQCELVYAVRSVQQFMPWVRTIYILTQRPQNPRLPGTTTVFHDELVQPPDVVLPTFNVLCIESFLHKIPGLAEHFIYFNDDCFVGRPLEKTFFFSPDKQPVMYARVYDKKHTLPPALTNNFRWAWRNLYYLLHDARVYHQVHQASALSKQTCLQAEQAFPKQYAQLRQSRFRAPTQDVPPVGLALNYGIMHGVVKPVHPRAITELVLDRSTHS